MKKLLLFVLCMGIFTVDTACAVDLSGDGSVADSSVGTENQWSDENVDAEGWV